LRERLNMPQPLVRCCLDLGHAAGDTVGNADEARDWAKTHQFRSLRVVTSRTHMPRALLEFRAQMPHLAISADPVHDSGFGWYMLAEYNKYLVRLLLLRSGLAQ
jgi:uncharacterized SAM-binding protein YcdF (DUF218 family)